MKTQGVNMIGNKTSVRVNVTYLIKIYQWTCCHVGELVLVYSGDTIVPLQSAHVMFHRSRDNANL